MKKIQFKKTLVAIALAAAGASHAGTTYNLGYDPAYPAIPGLGWRATTDLFIPTLCEAAVGTQTLNGGHGSLPALNDFNDVADCNGIKLQNTFLHLYDVNTLVDFDVLNLGDYLADTDADSFGGVENQEVFEVKFINGLPVDFATSMSLRVNAPGTAAAFGLGANSYFSLALGGTVDKVALTHSPAIGAPVGVYIGDETLTITGLPVPEPGSMALALAALAGCFGASRRSRR